MSETRLTHHCGAGYRPDIEGPCEACIAEAAAILGRKGGAAGRGAAKARPLSSERAREIRAQRSRRAQLVATAVEIYCPECGETQPAPTGSLYWTQEEMARVPTLVCCSCDAKLIVGVSEGDTLRLR